MGAQLALQWLDEARDYSVTHPPRARKSDPVTSKQAAIRSHEFSGKHAAAIFAWLCEHPEGSTYRQIAAGVGMEPVAVGRRIKELRERAGVYADGVRDGMQLWKVRRLA